MTYSGLLPHKEESRSTMGREGNEPCVVRMKTAHTREYYEEVCGADKREAIKYSKYPHRIYVCSVAEAVECYHLDCSCQPVTTGEDPRVFKLASLLLRHFRLCNGHLRCHCRGGPGPGYCIQHELRVDPLSLK
jgi:hypothetical protein